MNTVKHVNVSDMKTYLEHEKQKAYEHETDGSDREYWKGYRHGLVNADCYLGCNSTTVSTAKDIAEAIPTLPLADLIALRRMMYTQADKLETEARKALEG